MVRSSNIRTAAFALTGTAVLLVSSLAVSVTATAAPSPTLGATPVGLFGAGDPTYDGVFRQSLALLAYDAAGVTPPVAAVDWLVAQQCSDGGFASYRADPSGACPAYDSATYSGGEDTNATGLAVAALKVSGRSTAATSAADWLVSVQSKDGGWEYVAGSGAGSDANSAALASLGLATIGGHGAAVTKAQGFLATLQIDCTGSAAGTDGALAFQDYGTGLVRNDKGTVQGVIGLAGAGLPLAATTLGTDSPRLTCPAGTTTSTPAQLGAGYLMRQLDAFDGAIPTSDFSTGNPKPGTVDLGDTAWAALSLVAAGTGKTQVAAALVTLNGGVTVSKKSTAAKVASSAATDSPALLGLVALANSAGGSPSSTVTALVTRIGATQRGAATTPSSSPSATPSATTSASPTDPAASPTGAEGNGAALPDTGATSLTGPLAVGGLVLVFLGGLALLFSRRAGTHA